MYFLTGFASDGLVYGALASMIVSDMIIGKARYRHPCLYDDSEMHLITQALRSGNDGF